MIIKFKQNHISIENFNQIELADFTVLTGINGSGKSHLLSAINEKKVIFQDIQNPNIVLFNYETFKLDNEPSFNSQQLSSNFLMKGNQLGIFIIKLLKLKLKIGVLL